MTRTDVHGPIDFVLIEFPADRLTGEAGPALLDLVERGVVRLFDLLVISKADDGSVATAKRAPIWVAFSARFRVHMTRPTSTRPKMNRSSNGRTNANSAAVAPERQLLRLRTVIRRPPRLPTER